MMVLGLVMFLAGNSEVAKDRHRVRSRRTSCDSFTRSHAHKHTRAHTYAYAHAFTTHTYTHTHRTITHEQKTCWCVSSARQHAHKL